MGNKDENKIPLNGFEKEMEGRIVPNVDDHTINSKSKFEQKVKIEMPSQTDYISLIRQFVGGLAYKAGFNKEDIEKIELAIDEACTNVLQHSYKFESDKRYDIEIEIKNSKLDIIITDNGDPFFFDVNEEQDTDKHISELKVGGLGIYIMQQVMDEVKYESGNGRANVLRMVKYIGEKS